MIPNPTINEVSFQDYLKIISKRLRLIVALLIIIPSVTAIVVFTMKPIYKATVSILIEKNPPKVTKFEQVYQSSYYSDVQYYQTQYRILASRTLAESVINELGLIKEPEFRNLKNPALVLQSQIKVEPVKGSQIVFVHVFNQDPLRASSIANALAKAYIRQDIETKNMATKEAAGWLESQSMGIKEKMRAAEDLLNRYIQENKIVTAADVETKAQTILEGLKSDRAKTETELAEAKKRYKEKHPKIIGLEAQLQDLAKKVDDETTRVLELNQKMVQYNTLKKEAESYQQLYAAVLSRAKETGLSETMEASSIRVLDFSQPPRTPFAPKIAQSILMAIVFSLFCGITGAFLLEFLDATLRTSADVNSYLNLPFLGYVPSLDSELTTDDKCIICHKQQKSIITESYRIIRTSILFAAPEDKPLKTILVTSAIPNEGKSFFSSNLAIIFSHMHEKTLMVDMDMRKPSIHKSYHINEKIGISDYLIGKASLNDIIKPSLSPNLSLITVGTIPPNPSELLSTIKIRQFFQEVKSKFDRIIIDSPPILNVPDSLLLANLVDGIVFVVKGASTRMEVIARAKQKMLEAKGNIVGVVVNNVKPEKEDSYYYYHYYYGTENVDNKSPGA